MQAWASFEVAIVSRCFRSISRGVQYLPRYNVTNCRTFSNKARRPTFRASTIQHPLKITRGAKTKTKAKLKDLPQGALKLESYNDGIDDAPRYPTVVQGHRNNMEKFKNCVVLTRVGGFYEVRGTLSIRLNFNC